MADLYRGAKKVQNKLQDLGYDNKIIQLPESTRTAKEAAERINCDLSQIAKSIIFRLKNADQALLVIASGQNRINESKIEALVGDKLGKADADFVRKTTGYVIGGVPPLGHKEKIQSLIDEDLLKFQEIWAAAGHPKAVFKLTPEELVKMTEGQVVDVK